MGIGVFEINEPFPHLKEPHAIATLRPWIDCGSVGTLALQKMEKRFGSRKLARLARPGSFYDFTRYRPITNLKRGVRQLTIPNTTITWARSELGHDFVFLHLLEPHTLGEVYTGSIWQILRQLGIKRYCLLGSFYDMVPHTRPILVSGGTSGKQMQDDLEKLGVLQSNYEGPASICNLISQEAEKSGLETMLFMVHLPHYTELEEDYPGTIALLKILHFLYDIPLNDKDIRQADDQIKSIDVAIQKNRKLKSLVTRLEAQYDARTASQKGETEPHLSPEVDRFLKEMENRFRDS